MTSQQAEPSIRKSKKLPIVIGWGDKRIHLGEIEFLKDGSLVFESRFHSDQSVGQTIEFGLSNFKENKFRNHTTDVVESVDQGFHISLHPAKGDKPAAMHFRKHYPGDILFRRQIDWFPVVKPFNLLRFFTLPLDMSATTQKQVTIDTPVHPDFRGSLELVVDIFPKDAKEHFPYEKVVEVWGTCPNYLVRLSIVAAKQRTYALVYWPEDSELKL